MDRFNPLMMVSRDVVLCLLLLRVSLGDARGIVQRDWAGALTPLSAKSTICNVLNYSAVADNKTDIGPTISKAFSSCVVGHAATLYVPPGNYLSECIALDRGEH